MLPEFCNWQAAGKPVMVEEPIATHITDPRYCFCNEKDARIKELEAKLAEDVFKRQIIPPGGPGHKCIQCSECDNRIRIAALEEAAKVAERKVAVSWPQLGGGKVAEIKASVQKMVDELVSDRAACIRGMKK